MKTLPFKQFTSAVFFAAAVFLMQSCGPKVPGVWKNDAISSGMRSTFHQLNDEALGYLKADDSKGMNEVLSKEMIAGNNDRMIDHISNHLKASPYKLLDEYYVVNRYRDTDTIVYKGAAINRYSIRYPAPAMEMYMAFFAPVKQQNQYLVSLIYGKFNYGWKIIDMELEPYTINGKTGPELFALAKKQFTQKQLQASLVSVSYALNCFKPCSYWQYADEPDVAPFYDKVKEAVTEKFKYPFVLRQVSTGPMILRVYTQDDDFGAGSYPVIYYMTHYNLKDTTAVKKENLQVRAAINKMMPGLGDNSPYILYSAFNVMPTGYKTVDHFDMRVHN